MRIKIQPQELPDMTLPYPYFIEKDGMVGRQDFWKGNPKKLIGFSPQPSTGSILVFRTAFFDNPESAVGLYPVFEADDGHWFTQTNPIESVKVLES